MADIHLELYKTFYEVAENKSISKAAEKLFVSQSAVSQAVMQLEQKLGGRLFDRGTRGVTLTPEGAVLFSYIKNAVLMIDNAQEKLLNMRNLKEGEIKIGASDTICSLFLLPKLRDFNEQYPDIHISVTNRVTMESVDLLKSGAVDISFVNLPLQEDSLLEVIPVMPIHDCFAVGEKYAFLAQETRTLADLVNYPLLMLERASNSRRQLDEFLAEHNVLIHPAIELGSLALLAEFAKIGLGIAATVREDIADAVAAGTLWELQLNQELPVRHIGLATVKNVTLSNAAKRFIDALGIPTHQ